MKDLSIVIVNYNVKYFLGRCLDSIRASNTDFEVTTYVVDNASIDGSVDYLNEFYPDFHLIASKKNLGFSGGNNLALRKVDTKYVLLLNPDTILQADTLQYCYDYMEGHEKVGALGVKMIDGSGRFLPESKRSLPSLWNTLTKLVGLSTLFPKSALWNGYAMGHVHEDESADIQVLCGAFMFMRNEALQKVGLLDERFFMYGEDIDLSYRILQGGYTIRYEPNTQIIHYKGESTKKSSFNYIKVFYGAMALYVDKHYTGIGGRLLTSLIKIGIVFRGLLAYVINNVWNIVLPIRDFVLHGSLLYTSSQLLSKFYYRNIDHFEFSTLSINILAMSAIWIAALYFVGYYKRSTWRKLGQGWLLGIAGVGIMYALLPEDLRSSRLLAIIGSIGILLVGLISILFRRKEVKEKQVLIVSSIEGAVGLKKTLEESAQKYTLHGIVYAGNGPRPDGYINDVDAIEELISVLRIDEVIFNAAEIPMKQIMKYMMLLGSRVAVKIAGDDSLAIIGSTSKNRAGELYTVDMKLNLSDDYAQHTKRSVDLVIGLIGFILAPILTIAYGLPFMPFIISALKVIMGINTAVAYAGKPKDYHNLPSLKDGWMHYRQKGISAQNSNYQYARTYRGWLDLEYFFNNLNQLRHDE